MTYDRMNQAELEAALAAERERYDAFLRAKLSLNMARGKPSRKQLDQVSDILTALTDCDLCVDEGIDSRNYGELSGLPSARRYWAEILGCRENQTFVGGSSSLTMMYEVLNFAWNHGLKNSVRPWRQEEKVKFLCPTPGYDRHFRVTQFLGAELISVPMTACGPDMDRVEELVKDPAVKGIWCVPKYSNPQGITYSAETVERMAALRCAAPDFVIMWDNAYCIHEFKGGYVDFPDIISLCAEKGNPDMVYEFASTSKVTFPGAGFSVVASSEENIRHLGKLMGNMMICFDKVNQLRHVKYLKNKEHTLEIMKRHAAFLEPKFRVVAEALNREITPCGFGSWTDPVGGYFVCMDTMPGTAKRALQLCGEAGVTMTPAGATHPYGIDPEDKTIRIAPSFPPVEELETAMQVFCCCVKIAALEKLTGRI